MTRSPVRRSPISTRVTNLPGTGLGEVFLLAFTQAEVDLAIGTPRYPKTSDRLVEAAVTALQEGRNQYEHPHGDMVLRQRLAETFRAPTNPDTEITVTTGATEALFIALTGTVDPGDEVIILNPGFDQFTGAVELAGGVPRFVRLHAPEWRWDSADLAAAFGPRTKAVVLNSPSNPTGRVLTREELDELAELCERWDVTVICDEVYSAFVFDGRAHLSVADVPGLAGRSVVVGSLSKSHAVSGWRLGFVRADAARTAAFRQVLQLTTLGATVPLQVAAGRAAPDVDLVTNAHEMSVRRDLAQNLLSRMGMKFTAAEGGCFLLADISPLTAGATGGMPYVRDLLKRTGVLLAPGTVFFADPTDGEQYVRVAFNRPVETLKAAESRLLAG